MKFNSIAEAFNFYNGSSMETIEKRAAEIKGILESDPKADITSLKIEIEGLKEAQKNIKEKEGENQDKKKGEERSLNIITGMEFKNTDVKEENIFETKEYRNAFFKTLLGQELNETESRMFLNAQDLIEQRANQFTTSTNTPAVLPTTTLNKVISKARKEGGALNICRGFNIPAGLSIPVGTPGEKANWNEEGKEVETDKPKITSVKFDGHEIIKVFSISAKVRAMSIDSFEDYLAEELSIQVLNTINHSIFKGTGENQGTGIETSINWNQENSIEVKGEYSYTDFTKALALLKRGYGANAKFVMNNATLYSDIYSIVDENKRPIFTPDPRNELIGHILGKEVVIDDNLEDGVIILGDYNYMGYNLPEGIMLEVSRESSFKSGRIDYRALAIADTKPIVDEAFIKLNKTAGEKTESK